MSDDVSQKKLLLVEDEAIIALTEKMQLEQYGYSVTIAKSGEKAIEILKNNHNFELVLMDIDLGHGIDGTETAAIILKEQDIPIVFVSSHTEPEIVGKTEKITSYGYVVKNSSITVLDASIKMAFKLFSAKRRELEKEQALALSENKYRLLHEYAGVGIGYYSADGIVLSYNNIAAKNMGGVPEDYIGKSIYDLFPKKDAEIYMERIKKASRSTVPDIYEDMIQMPAGKMYFLSTFTKVSDTSENLLGIQIISQNITDLKLAEESLLESKQQTELMLNIAAEIIIAMDFNGNILLLNDSGHKILGYESPQLLGKNWIDTCIPTELKHVVKSYLNNLNESESDSIKSHEHEIITSNGDRKSIFWHNSFLKNRNGERIGLFRSGEDITDRRKAEFALQQKNEEYEAINEELRSTTEELQIQNQELLRAQELLLQNKKRMIQAEKIAKIGNWTLQLDTKTIIASLGADEIYGVNFNKVPLEEIQKIPLPEYRPLLDEALSNLISGKAPYNIEFKICRPSDGQIRIIHSVATFDKTKHLIFGVIQDITDKKQLESDIKAQRQLYEQILEHSLAGYWDWDIPTGKEYLSPTFKKMFGYEDHELENTAESWQRIIFDEDLPGVFDKFNQHIDSRGMVPFYNEVRYRHKNGSIVWVICTGKVIEWDSDGKPKRMIGCHIDITERKKIEEDLNRSQERFRSYIENAPDGIFLADESGNYIEVNAAACRITGFSEDELLKKNLVDLIYLPEKKKASELFNHLKTKGHSLGDISFVTKNGDVRFWTVSAVKISENLYMGFTKDITDKHIADLALEAKEEQYRFALEGSNLGEWDWNYQTGKVCRNNRWLEMLGYAPNDIEDTIHTGNDLRHPDDIAHIEKSINDHCLGKTDHYSIEYRMKTKNGDYKWIRDCGKIMVRDQSGNPLRLCGTHEDIDEKKKSRERIEALLLEKELLLKEVHHRIKNNMNTIRSLLTLHENSIAETSAKSALQDAANRVHSMALLYDKLYKSDNYTMISLTSYISSLIDEVISHFSIASIVVVENNIKDFFIDANKIQSIGIIINELITNIMKYAFKGRTRGRINVTGYCVDDHVLISLQDDGVGIPETLTLENSPGFGFKLVHALAEQLDGSIRIERDKGTKFILEFDN